MARKIEFDQEKIIAKAQDVYWTNGYEATSIQDLVDKLGISRSSLYNTFEDKHSLYISALALYQQRQIQQLQSAVDAFGYSRQTIETIFHSALDNALAYDLCRGCFLANSMVEMAKHDTDVVHLVTGYRTEIEEIFYQSLVTTQTAGELLTSVPDPRAMARHLYSTLVGLNALAKTKPDPQVLKDIVNVALSLIG